MTTRLTFVIAFVLILAAGTVQAGGDPAKGQELSENCAMCHGDDGMGDDETPRLAGLDAVEQVAALKGFASGEREDESGMMADVAKELSEQDMADLAAYYSSLGND